MPKFLYRILEIRYVISVKMLFYVLICFPKVFRSSAMLLFFHILLCNFEAVLETENYLLSLRIELNA